MARNRILQVSFTSGELDPRLLGRADLDQYHKGTQKALNVISTPHGGLTKRLGTLYVDDLPEGNSQLIRFQFSTTQGYLFTLKAGKVIIHRDGILEENLTINGSATTNDYIVLPYTEAEIPYVDFVQSFDTLILVHPNHPMRKITRGSGHTVWNTSEIAQSTSATHDFAEVDYTNFTFTVDGAGNFGSRTLTSSSAIFVAAHVGGSFRTSEGYARITAVGSDTEATINVIKDLDAEQITGTATFAGSTIIVEELAFSAARGHPVSVVFHQGRLVIGGTKSLPQTMWFSVVGHFFNFELGEGLADEAIQLTINADQVNAISHLVSADRLQIFTSGGGFYVRASEDKPITPANHPVVRIDTFGSKARVKPLIVDAKPTYINRIDGLLRTIFYDIQSDNYATDATSILSPQVLNSPVDMEVLGKFGDQEGHYLLVVNGDGTIGCLSTLNTEAVKSWTRFHLADGVECKSIREVEGTIYLEVSGITAGKHTLLRFAEKVYTDGGIVKTNQGTTITGLTHLEGKVVRVIGDDYLLSDQTVASGQITVERATSEVKIGLNFNLEIITMPVATEDDFGIAPLEVKRIGQAEMRVSPETRSLTINGNVVDDRKFGENVLGLGDTDGTTIRRVILLGYARDAWVTITQTDPFPFLLLTLGLQIEI